VRGRGDWPKRTEGVHLSTKEQNEALEAAVKKIKKDLGLNFQRLGDKVDRILPNIPIGVFGIDHHVLGIGGVPDGRVVEMIGPASSGKTTTNLHLIASAQKLGKNAAFVDAEHALDVTYANALGVDVDNLLVGQPDYGEQALQATIDLIHSRGVGICVVDSVAALTPKAELDGEMEDAHVGLQARMMAKALRKITAAANQTGTIVCFINQIREKIGVTFGSNETTPGGRALPFFASVRLDVRRLAQVKEGDVNAGNRTKIKAIKNKVASPFREVEEDLMFGHGLDDFASLAQYAIKSNVWKQSSKNYTFDGTTIMGKAGVRQLLTDDVEAYRATKIATLKVMGKSEDYIKAAMAA
jgi:recombination protein RecA